MQLSFGHRQDDGNSVDCVNLPNSLKPTQFYLGSIQLSIPNKHQSRQMRFDKVLQLGNLIETNVLGRSDVH